MIVPVAVFALTLQPMEDHHTALSIWNRARNAHGFNTKVQNSTSWITTTEKSEVYFIASGYDTLVEIELFTNEKIFVRTNDLDRREHSYFDRYTLRVQFLQTPLGILTSPPEAVTRPIGHHGFSMTVKGIRVDVFLNPTNDLIDFIEYYDPTPGVRVFTGYEPIEDPYRDSTIWVPTGWRSGPAMKHLGPEVRVQFGVGICKGFRPWIEPNFDPIAPDIYP